MENVVLAIVVLTNYALIPAFAYGCQLSLSALGATLIFSILRFANFSYGEMMSFGTILTILLTWFFQHLGISIFPFSTALLALFPAILGTIFIALLIDLYVFRFFRHIKSSSTVSLIASIGIMFIMAGVSRLLIGVETQVFEDGARFIWTAKEFREMTGLSEGLGLKTSHGLTFIMTFLSGGLLFLFFEKTRTGKAMRAFSDNEELALLSGIDPNKVIRLTWILAATLATLSGVLYGLDKSYQPMVYNQMTLPIFAAAIVGGFGNPKGALIGGFIIAFSESLLTYSYKKFLSFLLPETWLPDGLVQFFSSEYKLAVSFLILVLVLLIKPTGIFNVSRRVDG